MGESVVLYSVNNRICTITLNDPTVFNALSPELVKGVTAAMERADKDPEVRVVILTGNGKGFCAGANLKEGLGGGGGETVDRGAGVHDLLMRDYLPMIRSVVNCSKIVIGAINGAAAGAGASLALSCDLRVMAESAYLLQAFINIALVPDAGGTYFLTRSAGYARSLELSLSGKRLPAAECAKWNLTNRVVPDAKLMEATLEWASEIAQKSSAALALNKKALQYAMTHSLLESFQNEAVLQQYLVNWDDFPEGVNAFFSRRKPSFSEKQIQLPRGVVAKL